MVLHRYNLLVTMQSSATSVGDSGLSEKKLLLSQAIDDQCNSPLPRDEEDERYIASFPAPSSSSSSSIHNVAAKAFFEEYGFVVFRDIFGPIG